MKKSLFMALAAGTFLFSACSSDDALNNDVAQDNSAQQIVLQVASSGDGLRTRAGRPLYSSAALQAIDKVRVLVYNPTDMKIAYDSNVLEWKDSKEYTTGGHGRRLTVTIKGTEKLTAGNYKIVAVGYTSNGDYTYAQDVTGTASLKGETYSDITATLKASTMDAEEVFAGDADLKINDDLSVDNKATGEIGAAVTMHRQVAGGFGYFTNIPSQIDGVDATTLRLVMRVKNNMLTFNNFNHDFTDKDANVKYVVNGSLSSVVTAPASDAKFSDGGNAYVLYSINLKTWFPNGDQNGDGFLGKADYDTDNANWVHDSNIKVSLVKGSVFAGKFIIPFSKTTGSNSMELQLLSADGTILKVWNISITSAAASTTKISDFDVVRNHMYNLGFKTTQNVTPKPGEPDPDPTPNPGPDPDGPTPGTDQPEDLSKGQNLVLKVNDNWETIHQLELD